MKKQFAFYIILAIMAAIVPLLTISGREGIAVTALSSVVVVLPTFVLQIGALWYFLTSLKSFQPNLRKAYYFLALGLFLFGLGHLQLPFAAFIAARLPAAALGVLQLILLLAYSAGTLFMYIGMRKFARLLTVPSRLINSWFIIVLVIAIIAITIALPRDQTVPLPLMQLKILLALVAFSGTFAIAAGIIANRICSRISATYKPALRWLTAGFLALSLCYFQLIFVQTLGSYVGLDKSWYSDYNVPLAAFVISSLLFLRAGQLFKSVGRQYGTVQTDADALDIVMFTAQLASDPQAIDPILDSVRNLTAARQGQNTAFTATEEATLRQVYLSLENYLLTQESVRQFNKEQLRARLPKTFRETLNKYG